MNIRLNDLRSLLVCLCTVLFSSGAAAQIIGTPGPDVLFGTNGPDGIASGGGGPDVLHDSAPGNGGSDGAPDVLFADDGFDGDVIWAGPEDLVAVDPGDTVNIWLPNGRVLFHGPGWLYDFFWLLIYDIEWWLSELLESMSPSDAVATIEAALVELLEATNEELDVAVLAALDYLDMLALAEIVD